jgi:undecaprenyl pyrophosphate phosphatase UppP
MTILNKIITQWYMFVIFFMPICIIGFMIYDFGEELLSKSIKIVGIIFIILGVIFYHLGLIGFVLKAKDLVCK